jgi:hypothetical protein
MEGERNGPLRRIRYRAELQEKPRSGPVRFGFETPNNQSFAGRDASGASPICTGRNNHTIGYATRKVKRTAHLERKTGHRRQGSILCLDVV